MKNLLENNCFQHAGVVIADEEAVEWAKRRGTEGNPKTEHPEGLRIRHTRKTLWVKIGEKQYIAVFTDGSAYCTASEWLSHGGWGVFTPRAEENTAGHLTGQPCTSYRAEGRAILDAVTRAAKPICVICDNQSAVRNLEAIINAEGKERTWRETDECADFWEIIARHIREHPESMPAARWIPSHMDDPRRAEIKQKFLREGGDPEWINGNKQADLLAEKGAKSEAPPAELLLKEKFKVLAARAAQRMYAHIWAAHCQYLKAPTEHLNGYEPDEAFGLEDPWADAWDPHEEVIPEEEWLDGIYGDMYEEEWDTRPCDFDNPDQTEESAELRSEYERKTAAGITEVAGGIALPPDELLSEAPMNGSGAGSLSRGGESKEEDPQERTKNVTQKLAEARSQFRSKMGSHFPKANGDEDGMRYEILKEFEGGRIHTRLKPNKLNIQSQLSKSRKIQFRSE